MAWVFLACAGLLEVFWSSFLKLSDGFTKLGWSVMTIAAVSYTHLTLPTIA